MFSKTFKNIMFAIIKSNHIFVFWPTKNSHTQNGNMPKKNYKKI